MDLESLLARGFALLQSTDPSSAAALKELLAVRTVSDDTYLETNHSWCTPLTHTLPNLETARHRGGSGSHGGRTSNPNDSRRRRRRHSSDSTPPALAGVVECEPLLLGCVDACSRRQTVEAAQEETQSGGGGGWGRWGG